MALDASTITHCGSLSLKDNQQTVVVHETITKTAAQERIETPNSLLSPVESCLVSIGSFCIGFKGCGCLHAGKPV